MSMSVVKGKGIVCDILEICDIKKYVKVEYAKVMSDVFFRGNTGGF